MLTLIASQLASLRGESGMRRLSDNSLDYFGGGMTVSTCHGQRPVSSTSSEKLRNVRIRTMMASTATLVRVGSAATVRIMCWPCRSAPKRDYESSVVVKRSCGIIPA